MRALTLAVVLLGGAVSAEDKTPPPDAGGRARGASRCTERKVRFPMPDPDPHRTHVTHAWPHCSPCALLEPRPAFLLRFDGLVKPETVLDSIQLVGGKRATEWHTIKWDLKACVVERSASGPTGVGPAGVGSVYTTIIFRPAEALEPGGYDWIVTDPQLPALHWGVSTTNMHAGGVFVVGQPLGARHPDAPVKAQLAAPRPPEEVWSHLRNAEESLVLIREWGDLSVPRGVDEDLEARKKEFRSLVGDAGMPLPLLRNP